MQALPEAPRVAKEIGIRQSMPAWKAGYARDGVLWAAACAMMKTIAGRSIGDRNGDMKVVMASVSRPNANGYGKSPAFSGDGAPPCGFSDDAAACPPGLDGVGVPILKHGIAPLRPGSAFGFHDTLFLASSL
jgi:hypothetical protein